MQQLMKFVLDETAATAIEYGLIVGGISVAILASMASVGGGISNVLSIISAALGV